ncbi:DNL zinc finger domain protein [Metarhizium robertsii]|uniref:Zinc finger, DNL-type n=2 Tax=Metarhizium robertsii TaxID=568076 RepID=E9EVU9_METRA|nr:Zinc finger, DNL-type [Metarhizium robertsii ARSEF 23]EFZ00371.1 Zinc finger, DNL-type [Metarhizium robertsii ARSEF 23]EXV02844.1 DNL zinc finger domain protein [Metarhizium robertsii]
MASRATTLLSFTLRQLRPQRLRAIPLQPSTFRSAKPFSPIVIRAAHSIPRPPKKPVYLNPEAEAQANDSSEAPASEGERPEVNPAYYQLSFTCVPCGHRSHHNVSKQGYHTGSVLITCPSCRNRHVISDHLNIFGERKVTVEDLMRERGRLVKRGSLGEDGDIEFWPEETSGQTETAKE